MLRTTCALRLFALKVRCLTTSSSPQSLNDYFSTLKRNSAFSKDEALAAGLAVPLKMGRLRPLHVETSSAAIATLVTTVKNCIENGLPSCTVPHTTTTHGILRCLLQEGMIRGFRYSHDVMGFDVYLKYLAAPTLGGASAEAAIHGAQLLSRPTRPMFLNTKALRLMSKQYHPAIFMVRTSAGILTHYEALSRKIGGEVLCRFI